MNISILKLKIEIFGNKENLINKCVQIFELNDSEINKKLNKNYSQHKNRIVNFQTNL